MPYDMTKPLPIGGLDDYDALAVEDVRSPNMRNVRSDRNRIERGPGADLFAEAPIPGTTVGAGVVVGSFTKQAGTGTQAITHQLGTAPVAAIFWGTIEAASGSAIRTDYSVFYGMTDGTTSRAMAASIDNGSSTAAGNRSWQSALITILNATGTTASQASFSAWTSSTFTVNWTANDGAASTVHYMLFGTSTMSAEVLTWTANTSTGAQAVGTTAFTSDVVFHMTCSRTSTGISTDETRFALGMMCADGTQASVVTAHDKASAGAQTLASRGASDNACILLGEPDGDIDAVATFTSMSATGFTVNWSNAPASGWLMASLCIDGFSAAKILKVARQRASTPFDQTVTGFSATPAAIYAITPWRDIDSTTTMDEDFALIGIGAAAPGQQGVTMATGAEASESNVDADSVSATDALFMEMGITTHIIQAKGRLASVNSSGFVIQWITNAPQGTADNFFVLCLSMAASANTEVGVIRNYFQGYTGTAGTEKILLLSSKTASVYNAGTGVFDVSSESYTATAGRRFYVANTLDVIGHAFDATASAPNLRQYDGSAWSDLVTSGTNHKARFLIAFNDRFVSGYTYHTASVHPTQIRWCRSAQANNWDTSTGSAGTLEVVETSNGPLTGMFVLGERAFITKQREIIELVPTGTTTPVFRQVTRIPGTGCIAPYSFGFGEFFTFFLGPDDVFLFDGSQIKSIGERYRDEIARLIDYNGTDDIQGQYLQASAEYILHIGNDLFIYDFRQDKWYRDYIADHVAIGRIQVGGLVTTDVDHSEFMVIGTTGNTTLRVTDAVNTILGAPIDSYVETKDFYAMKMAPNGQPSPTIGWMNTLWLFQFHTDPSATHEIGYSFDRGSTWNTQEITANSYGIGQLFPVAEGYDEMGGNVYQTVRFRFRNPRDQDFRVYGVYTWRWDTGGMTLVSED